MDEKDDLKGRLEQAAGDLTDNPQLKREGQVDRAAARIKEILDEARTKVDQAIERLDIERARARTQEVLDEAKVKVDDAAEALKTRLRSDR
jgi:uncharacterized protein YjbJ (UPF0337 family)